MFGFTLNQILLLVLSSYLYPLCFPKKWNERKNQYSSKKKYAEKKKTNERREKEAKCIEKNEGEKVIL